MEPDERLKLVFDEALRALTQQQARLDNVRSRATTLVAAATLIASFLGGASLRADSFGWSALVAAVALFAVLACALVINSPLWKWNFHVDVPRLLDAVDQGFSLDDMRRHLASDYQRWVVRNDAKLRRMHWLFMAGLVFLAVEMSAWSLHFWLTLR